jgi:hypothetical protein
MDTKHLFPSSDHAAQIFKREWYVRIVFDLLLLVSVPLMIRITVYAFSSSYPFDDFVGARITCLAILAFTPMFFLGRIYWGDIHVDDEGIGWWVWGKRWTYIRWADVTAITIEIIAAYNQIPPTMTSYCLYTTDKLTYYNSQRHGMRFDDHIPNADAFIDAVDRNVRKHNIVVQDRRGDGSAARKRYFLWVPVSKTEVRQSSLKDRA